MTNSQASPLISSFTIEKFVSKNVPYMSLELVKREFGMECLKLKAAFSSDFTTIFGYCPLRTKM